MPKFAIFAAETIKSHKNTPYLNAWNKGHIWPFSLDISAKNG